MRQVLLNLIGNAVKFADAGEVAVKIGREPAASDEVARLRFEVQDTGIGISPALREKVMSPFAQADNSMTRRYGGTGLGLAISRRLVRMMGGELDLESSPAGGSRFHFTLELPIGPATSDSASARAAGADPAQVDDSAPVSGCRILLAEDNLVNRKVASLILAKGRHVVTPAGDGREAIAAWESGSFDLILMDLQMPKMGGVDATQEIRRREHLTGRVRTPVIALTANAMLGAREDCIAAGMDDYIAKPFKADDLLALVARWGTPGGLEQAASR